MLEVAVAVVVLFVDAAAAAVGVGTAVNAVDVGPPRQRCNCAFLKEHSIVPLSG